MPDWLVKILGYFYEKIPKDKKPFVKKIFYFFLIRIEALFKKRKIFTSKQVTFLDFEIAYLEQVEILGPGPGEVLVEAKASIVSPGTETAVLTGLPGARKLFPYVPGYSLAGVVKKVGKNVVQLKEGDRVVGQIHHQDLAVVPEHKLFKLPSEVSFESASFMEIAIIVLQGIRKSKIQPGDKVAVVGQGLIGQFSAKMARLVGASEVVAVANSRRREKIALNAGSVDRFIALSELNGDLSELKADVVIEAVGSPEAVLTSLKCARPGGKVILLGSSRGIGRDVPWRQYAQKNDIEVIGAHISALPQQDISYGRWTYRHEGELFLEYLKQKRIQVEDLITWKADPEECNAVYEILAEGGRDQVAIMFNWNK